MLNRMGARITGLGSPTIVVEGVNRLHGVAEPILPDRLGAGTFAIGAIITGGEVTLHNVRKPDMLPVTAKLREAGAEIWTDSDRMLVRPGQGLRAVEIQTLAREAPKAIADARDTWLPKVDRAIRGAMSQYGREHAEPAPAAVPPGMAEGPQQIDGIRVMPTISGGYLVELPRSGIEVQVLDAGYETDWLQQKGKRADWFTGHGDVFPVGASTMRALLPQLTYDEGGATWSVGNATSARSFPSKRLVLPAGQWNHYYVRAINGELRLWVNGEEVNGGTRCTPATGHLALEAEGAPIEFRNLRIRELP